MSCCHEIGQVIVQPKVGGGEALSKLFRQAELRDPDILYSAEDVLRHYRLPNSDSVSTSPIPEGFPSYPVLVRVPPGQELDRARQYRRVAGVAASVPNYYMRPASAGVNYNTTFLSELAQASGLGCPVAACGSGVSVAILDTGVDASVLAGNIDKQYDTDAPRDISAGLNAYDPVGHGTVVAFLIRQGAPGARIVPIKVMEDRGNLMGVISGLFVAIAVGAPDIINMSLSLMCDTGHCPVCGIGSSDTPVTIEQIKLLFGQVDHIYVANHRPLPLLVAAAGNVRQGDPLSVPACFDNFLAVGACEGSPNLGVPAEYSRYGMVPEERFVLAMGGLDHPERCVATLAPPHGVDIRHWGSRRFFGTSFAAPVVSAIAARYLCATKGHAPCSTRAILTAGRDFVMQCMKEGANRGEPSFAANTHGLGMVTYDRCIVHSVVDRS